MALFKKEYYNEKDKEQPLKKNVVNSDEKSYPNESGRFIKDEDIIPPDFETNPAYSNEQKMKFRAKKDEMWDKI